MLDIGAVMDAVGSERAALFGLSEGASISVVFAATFPERTRALILFGGFARFVRAPDYPFRPTYDFVMKVFKPWGSGKSVERLVQTQAANPTFRELWAKLERLCVSPGSFREMMEANAKIDVRDFLPHIQVPTLVFHRRSDVGVSIENARYLADHIPEARLVELEGSGHFVFAGDTSVVVEEISAFLTGQRDLTVDFDRVLATVLLTDIVGSTEMVRRFGDRRWKELLEAHDKISRALVEHYRGRMIKSTGDGILATFDGPARAIACAKTVIERLQPLGIGVRAGVHTGEVELRHDDIGGRAVHMAARVGALAKSGEVLVSRVVTDLVAGSDLRLARNFRCWLTSEVPDGQIDFRSSPNSRHSGDGVGFRAV
jgi:class 3 adenylate cyclase